HNVLLCLSSSSLVIHSLSFPSPFSRRPFPCILSSFSFSPMADMRSLFIFFCLHFLVFSLPLSPLQSISVRGHLYCGQFPMKDVKVKLIDIDPEETDDLLDSAFTDENGHFALSGATREEDVMQGAIKIYHHCGDRLALYGEPSYGQTNGKISRKKKKICTRKIKWEIPTEYNTDGTGAPRWFEIGTINMELGFSGYERDCRH
ncbi:hypothetical protein PMAYCL1PPCAC_29513, partial [Pristionchus mayeri]